MTTGLLKTKSLDDAGRAIASGPFVVGVIAVTQAFLPLLGARSDAPHPPGRIVNLSSVSGGVTFPFLGICSASNAMESLTDALRRELVIYGIEVVAIEPGTIRAPIVDGVGAIAVRNAIEARRPRSRHPRTPFWPRRHALDRLLDRIASGQMGITPKPR